MLAIGWEVYPLSEITKDWFAVASPTVLLTSLLAYFAIVGGGCAVLKDVPKNPNAKDPFWMKCLGEAYWQPNPFFSLPPANHRLSSSSKQAAHLSLIYACILPVALWLFHAHLAILYVQYDKLGF